MRAPHTAEMPGVYCRPEIHDGTIDLNGAQEAPRGDAGGRSEVPPSRARRREGRFRSSYESLLRGDC